MSDTCICGKPSVPSGDEFGHMPSPGLCEKLYAIIGRYYAAERQKDPVAMARELAAWHKHNDEECKNA